MFSSDLQGADVAFCLVLVEPNPRVGETIPRRPRFGLVRVDVKSMASDATKWAGEAKQAADLVQAGNGAGPTDQIIGIANIA